MYDFLLVCHRNYTICELFDVEIDVTLKSGLDVTQGHRKWCHSKAWVRFRICLL